jgi:hypothetical protein
VFEICLSDYPKGSGRNFIALKLGDCYVKLDRLDKARKAYEAGFTIYGYQWFDVETRITGLKKE